MVPHQSLPIFLSLCSWPEKPEKYVCPGLSRFFFSFSSGPVRKIKSCIDSSFFSPREFEHKDPQMQQQQHYLRAICRAAAAAAVAARSVWERGVKRGAMKQKIGREGKNRSFSVRDFFPLMHGAVTSSPAFSLSRVCCQGKVWLSPACWRS